MSAEIGRHLLAAAGLRPPQDEADKLAASYATMRARFDVIYDVDLGELDPATRYDPTLPTGEVPR